MPLHQRLPFFYGWVIVAVAFCVSFLSFGMFTYVKGIYLPELATEFATGRYEITLGFMIEAVVAGCIAPVMGWFLDRRSPRHVLLFGLTLVVGGYASLAGVQALWQFYAVMALGFGVGMSCLGAFTVQRITVSWFTQRRGIALALVILGASLSGMVMPGVCVWLVDLLGWRDSLLVLACLVAVVLYPLAILLLHDSPASVNQQVDGAPDGANPDQVAAISDLDQREWRHLDVLKQRSFWSIVLTFGAMMCVFTTITMHAFGHITDIGLTEYQGAGALFVMTLCAATGKPLIGWLTDRYGARVSIWLSLAFLSVGIWVFAEAVSFTAVALGMGCFGFGYAGMLPLRSYSVAATVGQRSFGTGNGLMTLAILPLQLAASPLAAKVYDISGSYSLAFEGLLLLLLVAAVGPFFIAGGRPATG